MSLEIKQHIKWLKDRPLWNRATDQRPSQIPAQAIRSTLPKSLLSQLGMLPRPLPGPGGNVMARRRSGNAAFGGDSLTAPTQAPLNVPHPHDRSVVGLK